MDLNELKIREEIDFWQQFIDKWKAMRKEPIHTMALQSLAHAKKKLQCYLLAKDILESGHAKSEVGDRARLE